MALKPLWTGSELLRKLLEDFLSGKLDTRTFCRDVEVAYNDAIDDAALMPVEQPIFEELFDQVVWFSPYPEDRREIPNYKSEEEIKAAALLTKERLAVITVSTRIGALDVAEAIHQRIGSYVDMNFMQFLAVEANRIHCWYSNSDGEGPSFHIKLVRKHEGWSIELAELPPGTEQEIEVP